VNQHYRQGGSTDSLPIDVRAASVVKQRTHVRLISFGLPGASAPTPTQIQPFVTMLESLPPASKWAIQEYALPTDLAPIIASIKDGSARAVSDGSFKDRFGTAAFTIIAERDSSIIGLHIVRVTPMTRAHIGVSWQVSLELSWLSMRCVNGPIYQEVQSKSDAMDCPPLTKPLIPGLWSLRIHTSTCLAPSEH
jgi:hypothetical protein